MHITIILIAIGMSVLIYCFPIVRVCGVSMYPTYKDGQIIICTRLFHEIKNGEVYLFEHPYRENRILIKRVVSQKGQQETLNSIRQYKYYFFLGDNLLNSSDSRDFGYVCETNIKAKVLSKGDTNVEKGN